MLMCYNKSIGENKNGLRFIHQDSTIIGTWISEEDNNWKIEFNDSLCNWQYTGEPKLVYRYTIANTSPQCGISVPVDQYSNYLRLTNVSDTTDQICYLLNGVTSTHLSLSVIDQGGAFVFSRQ